ncbi:MAG: hypothetical protein QF767_19020, partial [Alphaproteobacteria bacterium]|nr:hypothetical protein [Alphaproteobacteria bacterium]
DSVVPWLSFAVMVGLGVFGIRRFKPGLMEAWEDANPALGRATEAAPTAAEQSDGHESTVEEGAASS